MRFRLNPDQKNEKAKQTMTDTANDLRHEISVEALAGDGTFELDAFTHVFARRLEEAEMVPDVEVVPLTCSGPRGKRLEILGYGEDPLDQSLVLLAGKYFGSDNTLTMREAKEVASRATGFIENSVNGWLEQHLEISSMESAYARHFAERIASNLIVKIRVIIITDGIMSSRIRTIEADTKAGLKTTYEVWDQKRIIDASVPVLGSEDIRVDFTNWMPEGLPCLVAPVSEAAIQTYLAVIPGQVLADIFDEYGSLLLESNVRTFLSARGQVNRGIQATLAQEPSRFLAYNNGLTTTATNIELGSSSSGTTIRAIDKWQIVNGGQTTASLVHYLRGSKDRNVRDVAIQMKLVKVSDQNATQIVQAVAKYANNQNRITAADLFSTHEFHIRMEQLSRRLRAPAKEDQQFETHWYYERARGQWENDRAALTTARDRTTFEAAYPKAQRLTKTDWARYEYCWGQRPDLVSKGAQTVFLDFATTVDKQWQKNGGKGADLYGDGYFRTGVAKAIMYQDLRASVLRQDWYKESRGYLANIVAYAIARFASQVERQFGGATFDFEKVWKNQKLSRRTLQALTDFSRHAQRHLTSPTRRQANVTQWAKQAVCWDEFKELYLPLHASLENELVSAADTQSVQRENRKQRSMDTGFEAVVRIINVGPEVWEAVQRPSRDVSLSPMERDLVRLFGSGLGNVPTERQARALLRMLKRMEQYGVVHPEAY